MAKDSERPVNVLIHVFSPRMTKMIDLFQIYRNSNFQRDKPLLIENIKRKGNLMIIAWPGTSATIPKRKKQVAPTRRSLRVQSKNYNQEAGQRAQNEGQVFRDPVVPGHSYSWIPGSWAI